MVEDVLRFFIFTFHTITTTELPASDKFSERK
jgi:hypothetical protein